MLWGLSIALGCLGCLEPDTQPPGNKDAFSNNGVEIIPDTLIRKIAEKTDLQQQAAYLLQLCERHSRLQVGYSGAIADWAESVTKGTDLELEYAKALYWKSFFLNRDDPRNIALESAAKDVEISIELFSGDGSPLWLGRAYNLHALLQYNLYNDSAAIISNKKAMQILQKQEVSGDQAWMLYGDIYRTQGNLELVTGGNSDSVLVDYDQSYRYYLRARDSSRLANLLINRAMVHERRSELEVADSVYREAIRFSEQMDDRNNTALAYVEYATFCANRFKETHSTDWFDASNRALAVALSLDPEQEAEIYYQYGANYHNRAVYLGVPGQALYDTAGHFYQQVLALGLQEKNKRYIEKVAREIAKICPEIGPDRCRGLLLQTTEAFQGVVDSTTQELKLVNERMEAFQEREKWKERRRLIAGGSILALGLIVFFFVFYQRSKIKFLSKQLATRLEALRSQMNPHFISNSLNAIDSLINQDRNEEASEYIIDFSRLCRLILGNSKKDLISLEQEFETLKYYLSLEKLRMRNRLSYSFDIDPGINLRDILIPPMILQPFVENAIIHGIQNKQEPGHLEISVMEWGENALQIKVDDDGVGRAKAAELRRRSVLDPPSLGIAITRERIDTTRSLKGAWIEIIDKQDQQAKPAGTSVILHLPIIRSSTKNESL